MSELGRLLTAMVTPFNNKGEVDYGQAKKLALALLDSGSEGFILSGTTGEAPTLSNEEKLKLFSEIKSTISDRGSVVANTGTYNTAESIELTKEAEKTGADAILMVVPPYSKPSQEGLYQHFKAIAAATKLSCMLYNVPGRTVTNLAVDTVIRLSKIDNIVAVKEASGNLTQIAKIIEGTADDFMVYSGNDGDTFPVVAMGGRGVVSVVSHLVGLQMKDMIDKTLVGNNKEAATIHRGLLPLIDAMFMVSNPCPTKYALNKIGLYVGITRLPLVMPDEKSAAAIDAVLKNYTIDIKP